MLTILLTVKTGMRRRQSVFVAIVTVDVESVNTVHAFKLLEAIKWNLAGSCDELQQFGALFLVKRPQSSPEPLNLLRRWCVVVILCVALPVIDINIGEARNQKLQLLFVEYGYQFGRDNVMEAC